MKELQCCGKPLEFRVHKGESWRAYIPETAECTECNTHYQRKNETKIAYRKTQEGYECTNCRGTIMEVTIGHPIWNGPFEGAGSGRVHQEAVPYCPICEEKPSPDGKPIRIPINAAEIFTKMLAK